MSTILVTGASGYIAKHIVLRLLKAGHAVRGSVRTPAKAEALHAAMARHAPGAADRLSTVELDLTRDDGWRDAADGVDALLHTASPFPLTQPRDKHEVIRPAVEGSRRAIAAARDAGVGRVVLTSSTAAVGERPSKPGQGPFDERDWSDAEDPAITPYFASKTLAERAAWDMVAAEAQDVRLTVINPGFVLGAPLDGDTGTSLAVVERILSGRDPMVPRIGFATVDVGDIAEMHVRALDRPETEGRRLIGTGDFLWFGDMADTLARAFPERRVTTRRAPDMMVRLMGLFDPAVKSVVPSLGVRRDFDTAPARDLLGLSFRDPRDSLVEAARWLIDQGRV
jgi:dihydroflavonol-4-reductase